MNVITCAMQDFMARMNHYDNVLLSFVSPYDRTRFNEVDQIAANSLHEAMGYRREHLPEEGF